MGGVAAVDAVILYAVTVEETGGFHLRNTELSPGSEEIIVGAPGTVSVIAASGVAVTGVEEGDSPKELIADTVNEYIREFVRPVIFANVSVTIIGCPGKGGVAVIEYPVIAKPFDSGAVHVRFTKPFPANADTFDIASGTFTGGVNATLYMTSLLIELFAESRTYIFPDGSITIPPGEPNPAVVLLPSEGVVFSSDPANVVVSPVFVILRTSWLPVSVTKTLPAASTTRPVGPLNDADPPVPSTEPGGVGGGEPASVFIVAGDSVMSIVLMVLLPLSATYRLPSESKARPWGLFNGYESEGGVVVAPPVVSVVTEEGMPGELCEILRIMLLPESETYMLPEASTTIPFGLLKP
jgi:hypothetical protein